jgi:hypothetical protein
MAFANQNAAIRRLVAFLAIVILPFFNLAYARQSEVKLIDIDGAEKTFRFFDSKPTMNIIKSELPGTMCFIDFPPNKNYVELGCMPTSALKGKGRFTRTFTRAMCDGSDTAVMMVNSSANSNAEMQSMSLTVKCH